MLVAQLFQQKKIVSLKITITVYLLFGIKRTGNKM